MNVPNISQGIGGVATLPAQTSGSAAVQSRSADVRPRAQEESFSFTRLAWFDINGDGHIDPRAAGAGGDATLLVGSREADLPTYSRTVHTVGDIRAFKIRDLKASDPSSAPVPTAAQTRQAIDAYQRYGQASSSAGTPPVSMPAAPASAPTPSVVSLPTAAVATDTPAAPTPAPAPTAAPVRAVA
jgi:hypothetical protein